jgi:hypothetical protein
MAHEREHLKEREMLRIEARPQYDEERIIERDIIYDDRPPKIRNEERIIERDIIYADRPRREREEERILERDVVYDGPGRRRRAY